MGFTGRCPPLVGKCRVQNVPFGERRQANSAKEAISKQRETVSFERIFFCVFVKDSRYFAKMSYFNLSLTTFPKVYKMRNGNSKVQHGNKLLILRCTKTKYFKKQYHLRMNYFSAFQLNSSQYLRPPNTG